jgi:ATP-binding cassette subfamily B (MDR/TAP) protein 1
VKSLCGEGLFLERYMTELWSAQQAASQKTRLRGPVFALGQTVPFFGYGLSLYYGGYLISTEGLPYKNVIKWVNFAIIRNLSQLNNKDLC